MFWLALIPLMAFFLALFRFADTVEGDGGALLRCFSFYGSLYVGLPLIVGIPGHAPPMVRGLIRAILSAARALQSATASLVRAAAYIARLVGRIVWALAFLARAIYSGMLRPIKSAFALFARLIGRLVSAWQSMIHKLFSVISPPLSSVFAHSARLVRWVARASGSIVYRLFSLITQPITILFSFTARLVGWVARASSSVAQRLFSLITQPITILFSFTVRLVGRVARASGSVVYKLSSITAALILSVLAHSVRLVRLVARVSGSVVYKILFIISQLITRVVGSVIRAVQSLIHKLFLVITPPIVSLSSYTARLVGWFIRGSGSVTRKAYSVSTAPIRGALGQIFRLAHILILASRSFAQILSSAISSLARGSFAYTDKAAHMLIRAFRSLIHTLFSIAVPTVKGTFAYAGHLARTVVRAFWSLARTFLLLIAQPSRTAIAFIASPVAWVVRGLGFVVYELLSLPSALIVSGLAHGMSLVRQVVRASGSVAQGVIVATRSLVREVLAPSIRLIGRVIRALGLVLYRRLGASGSLVLLVICLLTGVVACLPQFQPKPFRIIAGSGNSTFEPILKRWGGQNGVDVQVTYKGSLDIMRMLEDGSIDYEAIWDADSLWTSMGDRLHLIKDRESIMRSPVVFGVKRPIAEKLGWIGKEVTIQDILAAAESEKLRVMMTSATQSNSGASAYLGFLYAFAHPKDVLTSDNLRDPDVRAKMKRLLATIDRTSESSGWLRDLCAQEYDRCDAMFNYESHIIELNQGLVKSNRAPLYIVYPTPGLGIADFPFSYVDRNKPEMEKNFLELQKYLLSDAVQAELAAKGRRVGLGGMPQQANTTVFNPDWGVDVTRGVSALRMPATPVIREALDLYQTVLRKPSFTVYLLDFSGSMGQATGNGEGTTGAQQLKSAMRTLLDQQEASKYLLQGSPDDVTLILTFDNAIINENAMNDWTVEGNDPSALKALLARVEGQAVRDGTNIYLPVGRALEWMKAKGIGDRLPAIILMTDGQSNSGSIGDVKSAIATTGLENVPVYGITFGNADVKQLQNIADLTGGRIFDGTKDLLSAFRKAKGNN
jgi:Ca-activated chloride channel family protein